MRARHLIVATLAGCAGFTMAVALIRSPTSIKVTERSEPVTATDKPFTLVDDTGAPVTERALARKPSVFYFGYTFCPEACPTTLLDLSNWIKKLGPDADKINYVFVTIDPDRDTPAIMHAYLSSFDRRIRGFTGTPEQIAKIAQEYRVYYRKVPTDDGGYVMDHSAAIYLTGPRGELVDALAYQEDDTSALAKLKHLVARTPAS